MSFIDIISHWLVTNLIFSVHALSNDIVFFLIFLAPFIGQKSIKSKAVS